MFYRLAGFRGLYILAGIVLLLIMYVRLILNNDASSDAAVCVVSLFWHFVDMICIIYSCFSTPGSQSLLFLYLQMETLNARNNFDSHH